MEPEIPKDIPEALKKYINEMPPEHKFFDVHPRHEEAMQLLTDGLCRIREAALVSPRHAMHVADVLHNIPALMAGEGRSDEKYLAQQMAAGRALIDDQSWRKEDDKPVKGLNRLEKSILILCGLVVLVSICSYGWVTSQRSLDSSRCAIEQTSSVKQPGC